MAGMIAAGAFIVGSVGLATLGIFGLILDKPKKRAKKRPAQQYVVEEERPAQQYVVEEEVELFYHYTNETGAYAIADSGVIIESENTTRDAILGKGVYVTDLPPSTPDKEILLNNYDSAAKSTDQSNVSYYVELQVPLSKLGNLVYDPTDIRRVYKHKGRIVLSDYNGTVYQR